MVIDGQIEPDATQWLAEVHARTAATTTAQSYADSLAQFVTFLQEANTSLRGADHHHIVKYVNQRTVDDETRVSGATWFRDRTTLKQFYTWLRQTHGVDLPITLDTIQTPRGPVESMREGRGVAKAPAAGTPLTPPLVGELTAAAWRIDAHGEVSPRSVIGARDAALIGLGLACGARTSVLAGLTIWELPDKSQDGDLLAMRLPGAINKGRREVTLSAFRTHLEQVWSYAHAATGSRRLLLKGWQPENPLGVAEVHNRPGGFWGITDEHGRKHSFNDLTAAQRRRLVTADGEPALLLLSARDGGPLARDTIQEITGDVSKIAEANADARGSVFPHVHTHDLRHTYATHLAALFMLGIPTGSGRDLHGRPHRVDVQSAVKMASAGLGHLDEATTSLYVQQVGLMITRYGVADFLGRS